MRCAVLIGFLVCLSGCANQFGPWTEREQAILAEHGSPDRVVEFGMTTHLLLKGNWTFGYATWPEYADAWDRYPDGPLKTLYGVRSSDPDSFDRMEQRRTAYLYDSEGFKVVFPNTGSVRTRPLDASHEDPHAWRFEEGLSRYRELDDRYSQGVKSWVLDPESERYVNPEDAGPTQRRGVSP